MRLIVALLLVGCGRPPVTVFAASSLKEIVTDIARGRDVRLQFEATSTLARQIEQGAPADIFITAAPEWLDRVKTLDRFDWRSNRLVVAVRKDSTFDWASLRNLALANEQVPAGKYAKLALNHLGIQLPARVIYGANVRDVLSKVSEGAADAAVVYATDVAIDPNLRIAYMFPENSHPKIVYSVGLLTENGREFYMILRGFE